MKHDYSKFLKNAYDFYKNGNGKRKYKFEIYKKIAYLYFEYIADELIDKGYFKLPKKFGQFEIFGFKSRNPLRLDFNEMKKIKKETGENIRVYFTNDHTGGYIYKINWNCANYIVANKKYYKFRPVRSLNRRLAKLIKEGKEYEKR